MGFTVEDGTGVADANSYATVAAFRAYHADRGREAEDGDYPDAVVEAALVRATDLIEQRWLGRFIGQSRLVETQGLSWPRTYVYIDGVKITGLPVQLVRAVHEYGWKALEFASLTPQPPAPFARAKADGTTDSASGTVVRSRVKVDVIEEETEYARGPGSGEMRAVSMVNGVAIPHYPEADLLMRVLVVRGSRVIR
jgi:hypothetical protein